MSGVCVFGQGQCSTQINNVATEFNSNLTQNISTQLVNFASSINAVTNNSQTISFTNLNLNGCNANFSNINQSVVAKYNFSQIAKSMTSQDFNTMMTNAATEAVKNTSGITTGFLSGGAGNVNNTTNITNSNVNQLISNFTYNNFQTLLTQMDNTQTIDISNWTVNCPASNPTFNISDISQSIVMDVVASQIASNVTSELVSILQKNASDLTATNSTTVVSTGPIQELLSGLSSLVGSSEYALIAIAAIVIIIVVGFIYLIYSAGSGVVSAVAGPAPQYASKAAIGSAQLHLASLIS